MRQPIVAITFDDCCSTVATAAVREFERHGVAGTFFVCGEYVGAGQDRKCTCKLPCRRPVTVEELRQMQERGWEISSHTFNHAKLDEVWIGKAERYVRQNVEWLRANGLHGQGLSYPWGRYSESTIEVVRRYHTYARATVARQASEHPERYRMRATVLSAKTNAADAVKLVCSNVDRGQDTVFFGHRIAAEPDGYTWTPASLEELIVGSLNAGARVAPMQEMFT